VKEVKMAKLLIHETTGIREFELMDEEVRIGREFDNNLRIADPSVSRYHAAVQREGQSYTIVDLDSVNGITVMGRKISKAVLADGAQFSLGQVKVTFQDGEGPKAGIGADKGVDKGARGDAAPEKGVHLDRAYHQRNPGKEPHTITLHSGAGRKAAGIFAAPRVISRPAADAASAWIITWFLLGAGHAIINGQPRKWAFYLLTMFLASLISCILAHVLPATALGPSKADFYAVLLIWLLPIAIVHVLYTVDAFKTGRRLRAGKSIAEDEYSLPLLFGIVRLFDRMATCSQK
jgi:hypothetical protein